MSLKQPPIYRPIARKVLITQWIGIILAVIVMNHFGFSVAAELAILWGYLALAILLKHVLIRHHRRGVALYKRKEFAAAIPEFEASLAFHQRHPWVDRCRHLLFLSVSPVTYREMALYNIAYCYGQIGEGARSLEYYQRTLAEYPNSELAQAALRFFKSAEEFGRETAPGKDVSNS